MKAPSPQPLSRRGERGLFGEAAARLCGYATAVLGWRPGDFWGSTPAELALALGSSEAAMDAPDPGTIDELKRRFPD